MADDSELCESPHTSVEWKIKAFLDLPTEVNYFLNSPRFSLSDAKWFLQIFPNGRTSNNGRPGWISLYLRKEYCTTEYRVAFRLGMKKADGTVFAAFDREETYGLEDKGWGRAQVVKRSDLPSSNNAGDIGGWGWPKFLTTTPDPDILTPDGVLTVFCNARIVDAPLLTTTANTTRTVKAASQNQPITIVEEASQTSDGIPTLIENLKDMYLNRLQSDVTIIVKDKEYLSHKSVLSARSTIFQRMFNHNMLENNSARVNIDDCDPDDFGVFLFFLYTGDLNVVSSSNAVSLYEIAKKYDLNELQAECIQCITRDLSIDLICDALHLATLHDEQVLLKAAVDFFNNNTTKILITPQWQTFISENPLLSNELIIKSFNNLQSNYDDGS